MDAPPPLHRINEHLPALYRVALGEEQRVRLVSIFAELDKSSTCAEGVDFRRASRALRELNAYRQLKYALDEDDLERLVRLAWRIAMAPGIMVPVQSKWFTLLAGLLHKLTRKRKWQRRKGHPASGTSFRDGDGTKGTGAGRSPLRLPWRPLMALLERMHLKDNMSHKTAASHALTASHRIKLVRLIRRARDYFPPGTGAEIACVLRHGFARPHSTDAFVALGCLSLFLPTAECLSLGATTTAPSSCGPEGKGVVAAALGGGGGPAAVRDGAHAVAVWWMQQWAKVDHSPDWDLHFLILLRRVAKLEEEQLPGKLLNHLTDAATVAATAAAATPRGEERGGRGAEGGDPGGVVDWGALLPSLYVRFQAALRLKLHGKKAQTRRFPSHLQMFVPGGGSHGGGVGYIARLAVHLMSVGPVVTLELPRGGDEEEGGGRGDRGDGRGGSRHEDEETAEAERGAAAAGDTQGAGVLAGLAERSVGRAAYGKASIVTLRVRQGTALLARLLRSIATYYHPSNSGDHSYSLALLLHSLVDSFAKRMGRERLARRVVARAGPSDAPSSSDDPSSLGDRPPFPLLLAAGEKVAFVRMVLPLVYQTLYGKGFGVVQAAVGCLKSLAVVAPGTVYRTLMPRFYTALDPGAVTETHQAPAMIKAVSAVLRPLLRPRPYLAPHLPSILEMTLPGIDSNDTSKTIYTLNLSVESHVGSNA